MKKILLSLFLVSSAMMLFQSCEKDDDNVKARGVNHISGVIETEESLDGASVYVSVSKNDEGDDDVVEIVGESKIKNKKFNITLKKPSDSTFEITEFPKGVTVTDKNVKIVRIDEFEVKKEDKLLGTLLCSDVNPKSWYSIEKQNDIDVNVVSLIYSDRSVKISGTGKKERDNEETTFNLNLQKGWNIVQLNLVYNRTNETRKVKYSSHSSIPSNYKWFLMSSERSDYKKLNSAISK